MNKYLLCTVIACYFSLFLSCNESTVYEYDLEEEVLPYVDRVIYGELPAHCKDSILNPDESNSIVINRALRSFRLKELLQLGINSAGDSIFLRSYSAKPVTEIDIHIYIPEIKDRILIGYIDSIPAFGEIKFKPAFLMQETIYKGQNYHMVRIKRDRLTDDMLLSMNSECQHYKMLKEIKTDWSLGFSNFSWDPANPQSGNWRELNAMVAREWIVITTNIGYMLSSSEYKEVIDNFATIFGADLRGNNKEPFSKKQYDDFVQNCFKPKNFNLGRTANVGGLGGGATWGVSDWNFYGHYASYSGWEAITHELGHCYGYSHDSNLTYPNPSGVSWANCISQLHVYMCKQGRLPYESREILGTHHSKYDAYRGFVCSPQYMNDQKTEQLYQTSKVTLYFNNK